MPFRFYIKMLKPATELASQGNVELLYKIQIAAYRANKLAFWPNICLVKTLAARFMLQRRGIGSVMHLGVQFNEKKKLIAHAWLKAGEIYITPKGTTSYAEIFSI